MTTMPSQGAAAPDFELTSDAGTPLRLSSLRGKQVVLYFYPKDDTPGCTVEAQEFRDLGKALAAAGATVLGVSRDSVASHCRFRDKYALDFPLLADPDRRVHELYGAWGEKVMYGKKVEGAIRCTFLIDRDGRIARVWPRVKAAGHAAQVLAALGAAAGAGTASAAATDPPKKAAPRSAGSKTSKPASPARKAAAEPKPRKR